LNLEKFDGTQNAPIILSFNQFTMSPEGEPTSRPAGYERQKALLLAAKEKAPREPLGARKDYDDGVSYLRKIANRAVPPPSDWTVEAANDLLDELGED
jgi:hypothetical protein